MPTPAAVPSSRRPLSLLNPRHLWTKDRTKIRTTLAALALAALPAGAGAVGGPMAQDGLPWLTSAFVPRTGGLAPAPLAAATAPAVPAVNVQTATVPPAAPLAEKAAVDTPSAPARPRLGFDPSHGVPTTPYGKVIYEISARHQVNPHLVAAVVRAESSFRPKAVSRKGACGLMQLLPATARRFGVRKRDLFDPAKNLEAGVRYLRWLGDRFAGNVELALAAYNAGEGAVDLFGGVPPYRETQEYLRRVLAHLGAGGLAAAPLR